MDSQRRPIYTVAFGARAARANGPSRDTMRFALPAVLLALFLAACATSAPPPPPTADVSARCVSFLAQIGYERTHPVMARGIAYLKREQEKDGSWFGRWGTNYIYGTWSVLNALNAAGEDMSAPYVRNAVDWLLAHQGEHQSFAGLLGLSNPFNMLDVDWNKQDDFYDWLANHLYIHQQIASALGLT